MQNQMPFNQLIEKWAPVLDDESASPITDHYKRAVTASILENQERVTEEEAGMLNEAAPTSTGGVANWNPVLIALVRRAMPTLMAYDVCGVQPMSGPTGLVFAMRSLYKSSKLGTTAGDEAFFNEANTSYSGDSGGAAHTADPSGLSGLTDSNADSSIDNERTGPTFGTAMATPTAETLGQVGADSFGEMGFTIEKQTVTAKSRALKAHYTLELAQDLKAIHGLDADAEIANILQTEVLAEINREIIRTINSQAVTGCTTSNVATQGIFDLSTDADGRWSVEKFKGLHVQLERECHAIAKATRRGKGNIIICSSDVATALSSAGVLDYTPAMSTQLQVDDTGNTFAGIIGGKIKVYVDPYATVDFVTAGYKGTNPYDAGVFYCPYVPLQMVRAVGEEDFQPRIGFKTRYGMVANPFAQGNGTIVSADLAPPKTNVYYRIMRIDNILA